MIGGAAIRECWKHRERRLRVATIDVDALREYLRDYYGTAMMGGLWPAVADLGEVDALDGHELCERAEELGIDLRRFVVGE